MSPNTADHTWPITLLTFRQNITKESDSSTITLDLLSASPDKLADHQGDRRQSNNCSRLLTKTRILHKNEPRKIFNDYSKVY